MEPSISSFAYKGTIPEAIAEAKRQKKLFVVHISGNNAESAHLEESTWVDPKVAESVSKYCILLQIPEGSTDATNFSAIYPQKSTPSITVIGYNGVQLWQNEGFVSADILVSSLEKAWLSLHIQETTATFLTAAISSKKPQPHEATASLEQGASSSLDVPSLSTNNHGPPVDEDINSKLANQASPGEIESSSSLRETTKESPSLVKDPKDSGVGHMSSSAKDECPVPEKNLSAVDHHSLATTGASQAIGSEEPEALQYKKASSAEDNKIDSGGRAEKATVSVQGKKADALEEDKSDALYSCLSQSTVYLNIRLLDGATLQRMFLLTSILRMVKDYVDENQASTIGSYDLAIPYPRQVFNDQDLNKTLSELGLFGRQALIVVPHNQAAVYHRGGSSSLGQTISTIGHDTSNRSNEGYFGLVKRILSYVNPFSYLGGGASSSNSAQESQSGIWQYSPNPAPQNNLRSTGRPHAVNSSDQSTLTRGRNNSKSRQQSQPARFGSNIHTLKHEEDDSRFSDRNAFWNGNSTQYGGDNDGK